VLVGKTELKPWKLNEKWCWWQKDRKVNYTLHMGTGSLAKGKETEIIFLLLIKQQDAQRTIV